MYDDLRRRERERFRKSFEFSNQHLPLVYEKIAPFYLQRAPLKLTLHNGSDLVVNLDAGQQMGLRIRDNEAFEKYRYQFTIRNKTLRGNPSEMHRIEFGDADSFFYGILTADHTDFAVWHLFDLHVFRDCLKLIAAGEMAVRTGEPKNVEGSTFLWFDYRDFPSELILCGCEPKAKAAKAVASVAIQLELYG